MWLNYFQNKWKDLQRTCCSKNSEIQVSVNKARKLKRLWFGTVAQKTHPGPQERRSSSKGQRPPPAFAYRHQQGWLTRGPAVRGNWHTPTRFLRDTQVSAASGALKQEESGEKSQRDSHPHPFLPYLVMVLTVRTVQIRAWDSPFPSEIHLPFLPAPTRFACLPPRPTPPLQDNLSSDRISFILVISFYGPASPSRCKTRNVHSKQPEMVCIPYASVCGYQVLCLFINIKMSETWKGNALVLMKSHGAGIWGLSALAFVKLQKSKHVPFPPISEMLHSLKPQWQFWQKSSMFEMMVGNRSGSHRHRGTGPGGLRPRSPSKH